MALDLDLADKVSNMIEHLGSVTAVANALGVSRRTVGRYRDRESAGTSETRTKVNRSFGQHQRYMADVKQSREGQTRHIMKNATAIEKQAQVAELVASGDMFRIVIIVPKSADYPNGFKSTGFYEDFDDYDEILNDIGGDWDSIAEVIEA